MEPPRIQRARKDAPVVEGQQQHRGSGEATRLSGDKLHPLTLMQNPKQSLIVLCWGGST